ncbi:MAG: hypothetical protein Q6351_003660 [Candidatus Njordarchaeum guaymaensis]
MQISKEMLSRKIEYIKKQTPEIYMEAIRALKDHNVKKYIFKPSNNEIWLVVGKEGEYLVVDYEHNGEISFACSCPDYLFHSLFKTGKKGIIRRRKYCYHIVARMLAELGSLGEDNYSKFVDEIIEEDAVFHELISEIIAEAHLI